MGLLIRDCVWDMEHYVWSQWGITEVSLWITHFWKDDGDLWRFGCSPSLDFEFFKKNKSNAVLNTKIKCSLARFFSWKFLTSFTFYRLSTIDYM